MTTPQERQQALKNSLAERVLVLDGAMGTMIHAAPLSIETDYLGRENCPEILNVTRPDVIQDIHRAYLEAGADIIETNTFGGTRIVLADNQARRPRLRTELRRRQTGARSGRRVLHRRASRASWPAPSGRPTKISTSPARRLSPSFAPNYYDQAKGLVEGGADYLLIETCFDTRNLKAGLLAMRTTGARSRHRRFR